MAAADLARKARADAVLRRADRRHRLAAPGAARRARRRSMPSWSRSSTSRASSSRRRSRPRTSAACRSAQTARLQVDGLAEPVSRTRGAHQPEHAGRHARGDGLPRARSRSPALRQGLFARGSIERAAQARAGRAALGRARRPGPALRARGGRAARSCSAAVTLGARGDAQFDGRLESAVEIVERRRRRRDACCAAAPARCATARRSG